MAVVGDRNPGPDQNFWTKRSISQIEAFSKSCRRCARSPKQANQYLAASASYASYRSDSIFWLAVIELTGILK
jgi:hypothetical protein